MLEHPARLYSLTNHIAIAFPPLTLFRHTTVCFADIRQHLTLSILAHFQNGDQQTMSNTDDERVSKFQLQRPSQKISLRFFVTISVTLINCTLVSGNPVRARASLLWPPAQTGLRPELLLAGYVASGCCFWRCLSVCLSVSLSVRLSVRRNSRKLLIGN